MNDDCNFYFEKISEPKLQIFEPFALKPLLEQFTSHIIAKLAYD